MARMMRVRIAVAVAVTVAGLTVAGLLPTVGCTVTDSDSVEDTGPALVDAVGNCELPFLFDSRQVGSGSPAHWFVCPPNCLSMVDPTVAVYGSFPYDGHSSICLAGIHSGAIDDRVGGAVRRTRIFPMDWSKSSTQTIFPYDSYKASYSNGVQSLEVPIEWRPLPSNGSSDSWTVASRGLRVHRHTAPFSPRSDHAHVSTAWGWTFGDVDLIIGGRNATHRMNDVWMHVGPASVHGHSLWGDWRRLPDAPFTPRSSVIAYAVNSANKGSYSLFVIGGQTGEEACGLPELGICSNEVRFTHTTPPRLSPHLAHPSLTD
jgi:hypothetical protein